MTKNYETIHQTLKIPQNCSSVTPFLECADRSSSCAPEAGLLLCVIAHFFPSVSINTLLNI